MKITCINDLVNIIDDFTRDVIIDPYMFQSCEIQSYNNLHQFFIRYGNVASESGQGDCFCITGTYKIRQEAEKDRDELINMICLAKNNRRLYK